MKVLIVTAFVLSGIVCDEVGIQKFASGNALFTVAAYKELSLDSNENILVSPFSAEIVFALTQSGAKGETGQEIRQGMNFPTTKQDTETIVKSLLPTITNTSYVLKTVNTIFVEENYPIRKEFQNVARDVYEAELQHVEFADVTKTIDRINKWVEEQTGDKIHDVVNADDIDSSTLVVLVNALYFEAEWAVPFYSALTKKSRFFTSFGHSIQVDTLNANSLLVDFYESKELDAKFLEIPFQGEEASMTIILPNEIEGISVLEEQINTVRTVPKYTKILVEVSLPKFKIEDQIDLKKLLQKLGVKRAFDASADFSGISGAPGELFIYKALQKTFLSINEEGAKAAAASVVIMDKSLSPPPAKRFIADHPFIFSIKAQGVVLFEGRVMVPLNEN